MRNKAKDLQGLEVVGGASPTGKLPRAIGDGIFGVPGQDDGIFSMGVIPMKAEGIFFSDYATSDIDLQQPDTDWVLQRRPGQPLYPGATGRGIVLIGGSMGQEPEGSGGLIGFAMKVGAGAALAFLLARYVKRG